MYNSPAFNQLLAQLAQGQNFGNGPASPMPGGGPTAVGKMPTNGMPMQPNMPQTYPPQNGNVGRLTPGAASLVNFMKGPGSYGYGLPPGQNQGESMPMQTLPPEPAQPTQYNQMPASPGYGVPNKTGSYFRMQ